MCKKGFVFAIVYFYWEVMPGGKRVEFMLGILPIGAGMLSDREVLPYCLFEFHKDAYVWDAAALWHTIWFEWRYDREDYNLRLGKKWLHFAD